MASAFPNDEEAQLNNNNYIKKPDPADSLENGIEDNDALTAEFRHRLGILDDDADLSEAFKASIGILGGEGNMAVDEIIWQMDEERDATISRFKFTKYLKDHLHKGTDGSWSDEPIKHSLLPKKHDVDKMASLAIFIAIQRFMGDNKPPPNAAQSKSKIPIITRLYRTLEAYARGRKSSTSSMSGNEESFKLKKRRSSWKKIFKRSNSERDAEDARIKKTGDSEEFEYTFDVSQLAEEVPTDELDLVHFIIGHGILRRDLRDETYCQLCKQLTNNPSKESEALGWRLVSMCCSTYTPSEQLDKYFRCFLKDTALDFKEYAGYARRMLRRINATGMRYHPPNWLEFQAAKIKKYVLLPISFADHRVESLEADAATTAGEMCALLVNKIGLKDDFGFSMFISIYDKVSSLGSGSDHVMDAISECEQIVRGKGKNEEDSPWRLYFRKEYFSPWHDPSYDEVATHLIYKQICRGVRSEEYHCRSEDDLVKFAAQKMYIEHEGQLVPGKIQQELAKTLPKSILQDSTKTRDSWTQAIMAYIQERGYVEKKTKVIRVKESIVFGATRKWPMQFSGLFEAYKLSGPRLPKNDIVVAVNCQGIFIMHEPYKVTMGYPYFEIVELVATKATKQKGQCFNLVTIKGDEYSFLSPNSETISKLVSSFLDGLRQRSVYCIGLQPFTLQGDGTKPFKFAQGDFIEILEQKPDPPKDDWAVGRCDASGTKGQFPIDTVYIIPTLEKPPPEFIYMFQGMTKKDYDTLPRQKGAVILGKGTIGRHHKFGKESAA